MVGHTVSRKTILLIGGVAGMLNYLGYAFVHDIVSLTINGCILGGISSITFSQLFAYARDLLARSEIPPSQAPLYMNVFRLFFAVSWTTGPAVASWVMLRYDFVGMFLVAALCFFLFVIILLAFVPSDPALRKAHGRRPPRSRCAASSSGSTSWPISSVSPSCSPRAQWG